MNLDSVSDMALTVLKFPLDAIEFLANLSAFEIADDSLPVIYRTVVVQQEINIIAGVDLNPIPHVPFLRVAM